jgi:excinuclease ABC subunit B
MERTGGVFVEQVIRPTGLIDPPSRSAPSPGKTANQVDDCIYEVKETAKAGYRSLVTVLTKKMAEDLTEYMHEQGVRVRYCTPTSTRWSGSRSSATCAWASSTC